MFFAAHCLTLAMFAGTGDVTTGLITHGRPELAGAERTAGLFLNTVPLRLDVTRDRWLDVAREAFRQEQDGHPHRRYPLSAIREDHGGPVLDTAFNYVHFHQLSQVLGLPDVRLRDVRTWEETDFGLLVNVVTEPDGGRVWMRIDHDGTGFSADQAALFADGYRRILRSMVEDPHAEPDFAFLAGRPALARAAHHPTVVERFARQAARTPQATALVMGEERWDYARLDATAARVARRLCGLGAPLGARIGIAMDRSPRTVAVLLGVLRAGCAVVPLDVGYPAKRLAEMQEQAKPFRVIAHTAHAGLVRDPSLLLPAESVTEPSAGPVAEPPAAIPADTTAYVLFTSGSTGGPRAWPCRTVPWRAWSPGRPGRRAAPRAVPPSSTRR